MMPTESLPMNRWKRPKRVSARAQQPSLAAKEQSVPVLEVEAPVPAVHDREAPVPAVDVQARGAAAAEAPALFCSALSGGREVNGGYKKAGVIAVVLHALVVGVAVAMPSSKIETVAEEPEIVFLQFSPAPAAAGPKLAAVVPAQEPQAAVRARPKRRPELAIPTPAPAVETPPEVAKVEEAPVEAAVDASPSEAIAATATGVVGGEGAGGTAAGDGVVPGGAGMGVFGDAAVPARQLAHPPRVLRRVEAEYPRWAERSGIQGRVIVRVIIGADGRIEQDSLKVMRSIPELDDAAVTAARGWRFTPGRTAAGKVVRVIVDIPFQFTLR